uniref:CitMHS domain-containing protein n=1 Tax=Elaeophora elaphi TaxID=1147741 RepID=A0A0R3RTW8_9BILA
MSPLKSHVRYQEPEPTSILSVIWKMRTYLALTLTPIILLPLLFSFPQSQNEAKCGYCVGIMAVYWVMEVLPLAVTALLPMVLYPLLGLMASDDVAQMYLPDISFLFIGGLMVAVAVQKCKLHNRVALFVLTVIPPQPCWIMLGFMLVTAFLSMWISNTATAALMVPIANSVIMELAKSNRRNEFNDRLMGEALVEDRYNENSDGRRKSLGTFSIRDPAEVLSKDEHRVAKGLLISVAFAANIGGIGTITGTPSNLVLMGQIKEIFPLADTDINFISWMVFAVPLVTACLFTTWITLILIFLRNASEGHRTIKDKLRQKYDELPGLSFAEVGVSICFLILLTLWITRDPHIVPGFRTAFKKGHVLFALYVTDATSAMLVAIILFAVPNQKPNFFGSSKSVETLLDWKTMQTKFPWSIMLLLGGGFAMAAGVKESNLSYRIGEVMQLLQMFPVNIIMAICIFITVFLTNICSNTVTASIFIPIVAELAKSLEIHPLYLMIPTALASSMAFTLPVATPPNAIVFASGLVRVNDMLLAGILATIECGILIILFMMTWTTYLFELNKFPLWAYTPAELVYRNHTLFDLLTNATAR